MSRECVIALLVVLVGVSILDAWMFVHVYRAKVTGEEGEE